MCIRDSVKGAYKDLTQVYDNYYSFEKPKIEVDLPVMDCRNEVSIKPLNFELSYSLCKLAIDNCTVETPLDKLGQDKRKSGYRKYKEHEVPKKLKYTVLYIICVCIYKTFTHHKKIH